MVCGWEFLLDYFFVILEDGIGGVEGAGGVVVLLVGGLVFIVVAAILGVGGGIYLVFRI